MQLSNLDQLKINFNADQLWLVNLTIAIIMFGVALEINKKDFILLIKQPKPMIFGIISQFLFVPIITISLIFMLKPHPSIALGMIMIASCPGGNVSNFMAKLANGNAALSVSLTAFSTLFALLMTPLSLAFLGNLYQPTAQILEAVKLNPLEIVKIISLILGIPLLLGMLVNAKFPKTAEKIAKLLKPISILIFLAFVSIAFANNFDIFIKNVKYVLFYVLIHNVALFIAGYLFAKSGKLSKENTKTITIETGIQNAGLGLMLTFLFFPNLGGMALLVAFWAIWDILSGLILASYWNKKN